MQRKKKSLSFLLLENSRPLSPWGSLDFLSTYIGTDSLRNIIEWKGMVCRVWLWAISYNVLFYGVRHANEERITKIYICIYIYIYIYMSKNKIHFKIWIKSLWKLKEKCFEYWKPWIMAMQDLLKILRVYFASCISELEAFLIPYYLYIQFPW